MSSGSNQSSMFDSFPPVTLTVSSFFKQVKNYMIYPSIKIRKVDIYFLLKTAIYSNYHVCFVGSRQAKRRASVQVLARLKETISSFKEAKNH